MPMGQKNGCISIYLEPEGLKIWKDLFNFLICDICGMEDLSLFNINDLGLKLTFATPKVIFDCRAKLGEAI